MTAGFAGVQRRQKRALCGCVPHHNLQVVLKPSEMTPLTGTASAAAAGMWAKGRFSAGEQCSQLAGWTCGRRTAAQGSEPRRACLAAFALVELAERAGVPPGVLNVLTGDAPAIGDAMTKSQEVGARRLQAVCVQHRGALKPPLSAAAGRWLAAGRQAGPPPAGARPIRLGCKLPHRVRTSAHDAA